MLSSLIFFFHNYLNITENNTRLTSEIPYSTENKHAIEIIFRIFHDYLDDSFLFFRGHGLRLDACEVSIGTERIRGGGGGGRFWPETQASRPLTDNQAADAASPLYNPRIYLIPL